MANAVQPIKNNFVVKPIAIDIEKRLLGRGVVIA
jgi:hypothetical protein